MRRAAKRDHTEPAILRAISRVGADYLLLEPFDALILFRGQLTMIECKTAEGRHTQTQDELVQRGWPLKFVVTPEDALQAIGADIR
jgi:hypothetical protein